VRRGIEKVKRVLRRRKSKMRESVEGLLRYLRLRNRMKRMLTRRRGGFEALVPPKYL